MSEFTDYVQEMLRPFGPVEIRRMFGGHGVYRDGLMFALVHDDALYLKTDPAIVGEFESRGLAPFQFERQGKVMKTSYYLAPADLMEDRELATAWARRSFEAALRAQAAKGPKRRTKR